MRLSGFSWLAVAASLLASQGCSFAFVDTVPDDYRQRPYFDCTSTIGLPVADGVFALGGAVSAGLTLAQSKEEFEDENDGASRDLAAGVNIAFAAGMIASGIYGIITTQECSEAKTELEARFAEQAPPTQDGDTKFRPIEPAPAAPATPAPDATQPAPVPEPAPVTPPPTTDLPPTVPPPPPPAAPAPAPAPTLTPQPAPSKP